VYHSGEELMIRNADKVLEFIFESGPNAILIVNRARIVTGFNGLAAEWIQRFFGKELKSGSAISDLIDPDEHPEFALAFDDFDHGKKTAPVVIIIRRAGAEYWYETSFAPLADDCREILISITDITLRKQTYDILTESERRFKALMMHSPGITAVIDGKGIIRFMSESFTSFLGYAAGDFIGRSIFLFVHGKDSVKLETIISDIKKKHGTSISAEIQFIDRSGQTLYFELRSSNQLESPVIQGIILNMNDITDRKHIDEMMQRIARHNELILETASEGIFGVSMRRTISFINPFAASLLGYKEKELIGKSFTILTGEGSLLEPAIDGIEAVHSRETIFIGKEGNLLPVEFSSTPIIDRGKRSGSVVTFNDISHRKRIELELINARIDAENANRAKSDFLATMSHEIRTPLNSILGFLELMRHGSLDEQQSEYLSIASSNAENLINIISDILDLSKIEKGKLILDSIPFDPVEKISLTVRLFEAKAEEKKLEISFTHGDIPICLGDPLRLGQVITNLIGNAVKFTREGGKIDISLTSKSENSGVALTVEVADTGIGISRENIGRIFESFTQSDPSIARRFGGTGLGLSISMHIVNLMGGKLCVESEPGRGSRFFFTVVLPPALLELFDNGDAQRPVINLSDMKLKALLAEDTHDSRKLLGIMLEKIGIESETASNGIKALELFKAKRYDLVLMDGNMPEMDGMDATREIRKYESKNNRPRIPVIALTAKVLAGDRKEFLSAGADIFVVKPVSMKSLNEAIQGLFAGKVFEREVFAKPDMRCDFFDEIATATGLPRDTAKKLFYEFIQSLPEYMSDINSAIKPLDTTLLESAAHRLKGIATIYRLDSLASGCGHLEHLAKEGNIAILEQLVESVEKNVYEVELRFNALDSTN
jgi:PAS domain S-box-containing protein